MITENQLYRLYEVSYKEFFLVEKNEEISFELLNNSMVCALLLRGNTSAYSNEKTIIELNELLGLTLFRYKSDISSYNNIVNQTIKKCFGLFSEITDIDKIEEFFGNVLEQHINRKATGSYYTPSDTTNYITQNNVLSVLLNKIPSRIRIALLGAKVATSNLPLLDVGYSFVEEVLHNMSLLDEKDKKTINSQLNKLKILDPTCGSGAFVVCAYDFLKRIKQALNIECNKKEIEKVLSTLYGVDITKDAIKLTKIRLLLKLIKDSGAYAPYQEIIDSHFVVGDALSGRDFILATNTNDPMAYDWDSAKIIYDCIVGNPPYVESKSEGTRNYKTAECGNLYAYTIERSLNICNEGGIVSFIVPLPLIATPRMAEVRNYLINNSSCLYIATFADRPGCVFKGVHQRLVIFFARKQSLSKAKIYTTKYHFWYNTDRENLYKNILYIKNPIESIPKIGESIDFDIYKKIFKSGKTIGDHLVPNSEYPVYLSSRIGFWTKAFLDKPTSSEFKTLYTTSHINAIILNAFFNSSTFYYNWVIHSDCWHVNKSDYEPIYFDVAKLDEKHIQELIALHDRLMEDLEKNKKYIGSKQVAYEYKHKKSKDIIDKIDDIFAILFGFNDGERDYIKNYTLEYRLNTEKQE